MAGQSQRHVSIKLTAFLMQMEFSEAHVSAMQEDKRILLEEANSHRNLLLQRLENSGARLAELEIALQETAKNLILGDAHHPLLQQCI